MPVHPTVNPTYVCIAPSPNSPAGGCLADASLTYSLIEILVLFCCSPAGGHPADGQSQRGADQVPHSHVQAAGGGFQRPAVDWQG